MNTKIKSGWLLVILISVIFWLGLGKFACNGHGANQPLDPLFLHALHQVETGGRLGAIVGDNGKAIGPFQIHRAYWQDSGVAGAYAQCTNYTYAATVVTAYLNRYCAQAIKNNDYQTLARTHNGGPRGAFKASTAAYWRKVQIFLPMPAKNYLTAPTFVVSYKHE